MHFVAASRFRWLKSPCWAGLERELLGNGFRKPAGARPLQFERISAKFGSIPGPIDEVIGLQIIFRYGVVLPSLGEVLIEQGVEAVVVKVVLEHILRHPLEVEPRVVMLKPQIVAENDHP